MLNTAREIIDVCNERGIKIYDLVLEEEIKNSHTTEEEIRKKLDEVIDVMYSSATKNLTNSDVTEYKMIDGFAKTTYEYATSGKSIVGDFLAKAMAMAFSTSEVNASMGKIVAAQLQALPESCRQCWSPLLKNIILIEPLFKTASLPQ